MNRVWVQYTVDCIEEYECESYGWDSNYLFLNGVPSTDGASEMTVTISLRNILNWVREE